MTKVMTDYPVPDPKSLAFLLPLVLAPFTSGPVHSLYCVCADRDQNRLLDGRRGRCHLAHPPRIRSTGAKMVAELELPSRRGTSWRGMPAKISAAFTLVFVTVVNYVMYNRAIRQGTIIWGKIDFASQFVLIFLAFTSIWTMGLMGAVRSLLRKYFHTYNLLPDFTAESFTPTLSYSAWWITGITVVFFVVVSFAMIVTLRPSDSKGHASRRQSCSCQGQVTGARTSTEGKSLHGECD